MIPSISSAPLEPVIQDSIMRMMSSSCNRVCAKNKTAFVYTQLHTPTLIVLPSRSPPSTHRPIVNSNGSIILLYVSLITTPFLSNTINKTEK